MSHVWVKVGQADKRKGGQCCVQVCGDVPMECNNTRGEADLYTGWLAGWQVGGSRQSRLDRH